MRTVILVSMYSSLFGVATRLLMLSVANYPRTLTYKRWEDALSIVYGLAWAACCIWLVYK